jgi:hypothetical protein
VVERERKILDIASRCVTQDTTRKITQKHVDLKSRNRIVPQFFPHKSRKLFFIYSLHVYLGLAEVPQVRIQAFFDAMFYCC